MNQTVSKTTTTVYANTQRQQVGQSAAQSVAGQSGQLAAVQSASGKQVAQKKSGGLFPFSSSTTIQKAQPEKQKYISVPYIPPPGDKIKEVDLLRKTPEHTADLRRNAILAGLFAIAAFAHSLLVQTRMY